MYYFISIFSIILLLIAIPKGLPYDYYIFLRWIIFVNSIFMAQLFYKNRKDFLLYLFTFSAFIFNPIFPLRMSKDMWIIIDGLTVFLFSVSLFFINGKK